MKLYLVRHGEATPAPRDNERPLSDTGKKQVASVAAFLKQKNMALDVTVVWHSTKLRARQTAELLTAGIGLSVPIKEVPHLEPEAPVEKIAGIIARQEESLLIVGHLPHLNYLISHLLYGMESAERFSIREATVLCLKRFDIPAGFVLEWMITPDLIS